MLHEKMLTMWAKTYIQKYVEEDKEAAEVWARRTLPKHHHKPLAAKVKELTRRA